MPEGGRHLADETRDWIAITAVWDGLENVPIALVNNALGQVGQQGEIILSFGQLTPPPLMGTVEQQQEQARQIERLLIKPVARLGLTREGLDDLIRILSETRDNFDKIQEAKLRGLVERDET
jgi:hypothetical protein